jgi:hypothetical protein
MRVESSRITDGECCKVCGYVVDGTFPGMPRICAEHANLDIKEQNALILKMLVKLRAQTELAPFFQEWKDRAEKIFAKAQQ